MRLSSQERHSIVTAIRSLDPDAGILLFGSRADDSKRGGDIDLLILSHRIGSAEKRHIRRKICEEIGDQRIDIVAASDDSDPLVRLARRTGVPL